MSFDWRDQAACVGQPELFLTDKYLYEAQQICAGCPVDGHCKAARRQYEQITNTAHPGVWAGEYWAVRNNVKQSTRARRIL